MKVQRAATNGPFVSKSHFDMLLPACKYAFVIPNKMKYFKGTENSNG